MAGGLLHLFLKPRRTGKVKKHSLRKRRRSCAKSSMMQNAASLRKRSCVSEEAGNNQNQDFKDAEWLLNPIGVNLGTSSILHFIVRDGSNISMKQVGPETDLSCPSKFLIMCLNYIEHEIRKDGDSSLDCLPFFAHLWGFDFWKCHNYGINVIEITKADSITYKIAWVASTAAETLMMERQGIESLDTTPFLLYLVPSQEKAYKVHQILKPLEMFAKYTMILHSGVSLDDQIHSLNEIEPVFLVSTPDRLLELLLQGAIDISQISMMVIDVVESPCDRPFLSAIDTIRQLIRNCRQTVVFCESPLSLSE